MKQTTKIQIHGIWLLLFVVIYVYCRCFLSFNYVFVEQFTFFRFDEEYALSTLTHPGGLASYLASFLTQFYLYPEVGPLITAALSVLLTAFMELSLKQISPKYYFPFLSAIPALTCIWIETDFNYYLSGTVSLILVMLGVFTYLKSRSYLRFYIRLTLLVILSWPFYFFLGPNALLMVVLCVITELKKSERVSALSLLAIPIAMAFPIMLYSWEIGKDLRFQLLPEGYYLEILPVPFVCYLPWISVLLNVLLAKCLSYYSPIKDPFYIRLSHNTLIVCIQFVAVVALMHWGVKKYNSPTNYEAKAFDYYVRMNKWAELLQSPYLRSSQNYMHACYQNLALSSLNLMGDKLFACPQVGYPGLIIKWNKAVNSSTLLSDIYWQAGDVALAQEMAFEGMIGSRDGVNPRLLMRLVQTNLIAGNYSVAEKYINMLSDTYSYSKQAKMYRKMLYNDDAVLNDIELGPRKKGMQHSPGLTVSDGIIKDLEFIMQNNPEFVPAFHYYGSICLLVKNASAFVQFIERYHTAPALSRMPVHFQEAIVLCYENYPERWSELGVTPQVKEHYEQYRKAFIMYRDSPMVERKMAAKYRDTYWYYFMYKK